jgi:hypothetical protein
MIIKFGLSMELGVVTINEMCLNEWPETRR